MTIEEYLVLLLGDGGIREATDLINKGELVDKDYEALAIALLETEDKDMLGAVLTGCYEYKEMTGPIHEGAGFSTENFIFVSNGKLDELIKHVERVSHAVVGEYAGLSLEDRAVMRTMFLNAMQYEPLLRELKGMGDKLIVSTRQSISSDVKFKKPESERPISVT